MTVIVVGAVALWIAVAVLVLALCRVAARSDDQEERR
jgi:hypothetical protein